LTARPASAEGRPSVAATWHGNARLLTSPARRYVYIGLWVPNGLIVGCESLFVPYSPSHAGLLLAVAAVGMLAGDVLAGRFIRPEWRERLGPFLRLLLAAPYLVFALDPALPLAVAAITLASVGFCSTLLLQERLMALTPDELHGQALGLFSSGMLAMQGVGATIAGTVAQFTGPAAGMAVMAAASVAVTLAIAPGLRPPVPAEPVRASAEGA
ncbi:MFS transporter, partial [Spirillospora sp. NPDC049652]